jgi:hypothetical protein
MAPFTFNIAKGRVRELVKRVDTNTPADAKLILVPFSNTSTEATLQDAASLTTVKATLTELTGNNWSRKTLTDADIAATDYDDNNTDNRGDSSIPQVTWGPPGPTAGNAASLVICYNEEASPTDAATIPLTYHDFAVTVDGNNVVINAGDFQRAS